MNTIGCGELAEIVEGRLKLGAMPPLGGSLEPVGPIVTCSRQVAPGSLFWAVEDGRDSGACNMEEAYCRGARGVVVAGRPGTPFGGCYAIEVDDATEALCRLARWRRSRFEGRLVLAGPGPQPAGAAAGAAAGATLQRWLCGQQDPAEPVDSLAAAALALTALPEQGISVLEVSQALFFKIDEISHLCCPHVVCIYLLPRGEQSTAKPLSGELLAHLPDDGCLVEIHLEGSPTPHSSPRRITVGMTEECQLMARHDGQGGVLLDGVAVEIAEGQLPAMLACWGAAHALNCPLDWNKVTRTPDGAA